MTPKLIALIPAAGSGTRVGEALPKQYIALNGEPMIAHAVRALQSVSTVSEVIVVLSPHDTHWDSHAAPHVAHTRTLRVGGDTRGMSVRNGLVALEKQLQDDDWVLVHDAARPCVDPSLVEKMIATLKDDAIGGLMALPLADTIKLADPNQRVAKTLPREGIWRAQTPQIFRYGLLRRALEAMPNATDESQAIEALGYSPRLFEGDAANIKVTFPSDLAVASGWLSRQAKSQ